MKAALLTLLAISVATLSTSLAQTSSVPSPAATSPAAPATPGEREEAVGTITDITPERSLVLHTGTNAGESVVFRFASEVTYVDEDGKVVEAAGLRKNLRVRVSYLKQAGDNVVDKVTILE